MKTGYKIALSLTLAALCVALVAVTAVGVAHARYNQEVLTSTFPVTVAGNALQVKIGDWTEVKSGQYEATVTVANTTEETVTYGLQVLASLGLGKADVKLDDVYTGDRTEILPGSVTEDTFGSGWSFLFQDSQGEELRWEILGKETKTRKLTISGDLSETTLIRIQIR